MSRRALFAVLLAGSSPLGCGPGKEECDALVGAMSGVESRSWLVFDEDGARKLAAESDALSTQVAAVPVKHAELKKQQAKYAEGAHLVAEKLRAFKAGMSPDDVALIQLKAASENVVQTYKATLELCKR